MVYIQKEDSYNKYGPRASMMSKTQHVMQHIANEEALERNNDVLGIVEDQTHRIATMKKTLEAMECGNETTMTLVNEHTAHIVRNEVVQASCANSLNQILNTEAIEVEAQALVNKNEFIKMI